MSTYRYQLEPFKNWQEFEDLCFLLWKEILQDQNALKNGRQGQEQSGIDIYGTDRYSKLHGIQCKLKNINSGTSVSEKELRKEVESALTFLPKPPNVFILATTALRDANIQKVARQITKELRDNVGMTVVVFSWDDICDRISLYPSIIEKFYPHHSDINNKIAFGIRAIQDVTQKIGDKLHESSEACKKLNERLKVKEYFGEASGYLLNWPQTLKANGTWIDRQEEDDILANIASRLHSSTILLGEPGTGKSALLSRISQQLIENDEIVLAIKADQLDSSVYDFASLGLAMGLPGPIDECIKIAAGFGSVYVVIDQLDALSELVDVKSNRLSVLLNLIKRFSLEANVHLLASSRPFEFDHDVRLSSIKADRILLTILNWHTTEQTLNSNGIYLTQAEQNFKTFLCRPSNLNFYLSYIKNNPCRHFASYIELYEDIWNNSLGKREDRQRRTTFLLEIATIMTNDAKQSLPVGRYDVYKDDIDWLAEAGLLVKNNNNKSFVFAHQTLQAFVWTRSFVNDNSSLISFVSTHQHNLNIRPKLMTALFYLRDADLAEYNKQILLILKDDITSFRYHIIQLTIECVTAHHDPYPFEIEIIKILITQKQYQGKICKAISGKAAWFDNLKKDAIPSLMTGVKSCKHHTSMMLATIFDDRFEEVLKLLKQHWACPDDIIYIFFTLRDTKLWEESRFELAKFIITFKGTQKEIPGMLYQAAKVHSPRMAIRVAATHMNYKIQELIDNPPPPPPALDENASEMDRYVYDNRHDIKLEFEKLMELDYHWHDLEETAVKEPSIFVSEFWPSFLTVCEKTRCPLFFRENMYESCSGIWFHVSGDGFETRENYICKALESAIKSLAQQSKLEFIKFYSNNKSSDLLPVQRLIMKWLCELCEEEPTLVLTEVLADNRKMKLGDTSGDYYSGTLEVISKLHQFLNKEQKISLEQYIRNFKSENLENRDADSRRYYNAYNRKIRYKLLSSIDEKLLSDDSKKIIREEERAFGSSISADIDGSRGNICFLSQVSPMSEEQMQKAKDENILKCLKAFPDNYKEPWPLKSTYFGPMELGRAFERFASLEPQRAIAIMMRLDVENENAIGYGISGIGKSKLTMDELLEAISDITQIHHTRNILEDAAESIQDRLTYENPLDVLWLKRMEGWLVADPEQPDSKPQILPYQQKQGNLKREKVKSILWDYNRIYPNPSGNFQILQTISWGYLYRETALSKEWADILVHHAKEGERQQTWLAFLAIHLPRVSKHCRSEDLEEVIDTIIEIHPTITGSQEFAIVVANSIRNVSDQKLTSWLDLMIKFNTEQSNQIYGEILGLKWVINPDFPEMQPRIESMINSQNYFALIGMAFTIRNLWKHRKYQLTDLYIRMINLNIKEISTVLLDVLRDRELEVSVELNGIIDSLIANNTLHYADQHDSYLVHYLVPLVAKEPLRISKLLDGIISKHGKALGDISMNASVGADDLITASITIHNLGPDFQSIGLDMFEKLLSVDIYQIKETLNKIDAIPVMKIAVS